MATTYSSDTAAPRPAGAGLADPASTQAQRPAPVIVIGGGVCGVRIANRLAGLGRDVLLFNAEPYEPYNRVKLTPLLAGDVQIGEIALPLDADGPGAVSRHDGLRVVQIDRTARRVITADGGSWRYEMLVLATGSTAFRPAIPGLELSGVYTFRDAADAAALVARSFSARRVLVIGGGLLGLEAARGMQRRGAETTIVEHENRLMPRQLDIDGAARLRDRIEALGVRVHTGVAVQEIQGQSRVEGALLRDGTRIDCDTVIVCTGVRANIELAKQAELSFSRGILVDDRMRSSDPAIYAIGECAEHRGTVVGLVGPGLEQADVAAESIAGQPRAYQGQSPATKLKVLGAEVFSAGPVEQLEEARGTRSIVWRDAEAYRRIFVTRGRLSGAIAVGPCPEASRLQEAVAKGAAVGPLGLRRFERGGALWSEPPAKGAAALPDSAIVCNCTGVTCGRLRDGISEGARTLEALKAKTGASTVCGTCGPLIEELIQSGGRPRPIRLFRPLVAISGAAALAALATVAAPRIPLPDAFGESLAQTLWFDGIVKQWSGYILLGLTLAAMLLGLRKRTKAARRLGGYDWWRLVHLAIGVLATLGLFAHTGFRPGDNLNLWLFTSYVLALLFGAAAGLATGGDHALRARGVGDAATPPRILPVWLHVLAIWPLPVLLLAHVLTVYAF